MTCCRWNNLSIILAHIKFRNDALKRWNSGIIVTVSKLIFWKTSNGTPSRVRTGCHLVPDNFLFVSYSRIPPRYMDKWLNLPTAFESLNSSLTCAAFMRHWTGSELVKIMAWCLSIKRTLRNRLLRNSNQDTELFVLKMNLRNSGISGILFEGG